MRRPRFGVETRVTAAVAEVIKASGLSLRGMAERISVSPAYLSDVSRGLRPLSRNMAEALSRLKPRRTVRAWLLLQLDDDMDALTRERARVAAQP